jgi:hypothetical protein
MDAAVVALQKQLREGVASDRGGRFGARMDPLGEGWGRRDGDESLLRRLQSRPRPSAEFHAVMVRSHDSAGRGSETVDGSVVQIMKARAARDEQC